MRRRLGIGGSAAEGRCLITKCAFLEVIFRASLHHGIDLREVSLHRALGRVIRVATVYSDRVI